MWSGTLTWPGLRNLDRHCLANCLSSPFRSVINSGMFLISGFCDNINLRWTSVSSFVDMCWWFSKFYLKRAPSVRTVLGAVKRENLDTRAVSSLMMRRKSERVVMKSDRSMDEWFRLKMENCREIFRKFMRKTKKHWKNLREMYWRQTNPWWFLSRDKIHMTSA